MTSINALSEETNDNYKFFSNCCLNKATKFIHVSIFYMHARAFKFDSAYLSRYYTIFSKHLELITERKYAWLGISLEASIRYKDCFAPSEFSLSLSIETRLVYLAFYLTSISSSSQRPRFQGRFRTFELFFVVSPYFTSPSFIMSINLFYYLLSLLTVFMYCCFFSIHYYFITQFTSTILFINCRGVIYICFSIFP